MRAAGGVLWRPAGDGIEVAVVHRPRYDDWSLPKGKLEPGEPAVLGAVREVCEETGHAATAGRSLGTSRYRVLVDGRERDKTVRWWALRDRGGCFVPGPEVDRLRWLAPEAAAALLTAGRDGAPLRLLVDGGTATTTLLLVRHACAGSRRTWDGPDVARPLDERGVRQAGALAALLAAYDPARILSAPLERCTRTVAPLAAACGREVEPAPELSDEAYAREPRPALRLLRSLATGSGATVPGATVPGAVVVCAQGGALPAMVGELTSGSAAAVTPGTVAKGAAWALSFTGGRLVDADLVPAPA